MRVHTKQPAAASKAGKAPAKKPANEVKTPKPPKADTFEASKVGHRAPIPASWKKYDASAGAKLVADIIDKTGDSLALRLPDGKAYSANWTDSRAVAALVKSGELTLYKNPKDSRSDPDDETGRTSWVEGYYLAPSPGSALEKPAAGLESLLKSAGGISDRVNKELDAYHTTIHASRVNDFARSEKSFDLAKIKAEVRAARPGLEKAIADYETASKQWQAQASQLRGSSLSKDEKAFLGALLDDNQPVTDGAESLGKDDFQLARDILKIQDQIYSRPEVMSIDPGNGAPLRIEVDSEALVAHGGSMKGYADALKAELKKAGVKTEVDVDTNYSLDRVLRQATRKVLEPVIGPVPDGYGASGSDWDKGSSLTLQVDASKLAKARTLLPQLRAELEKYGMRYFAQNLKLEAAS